MPKTHRVWQFTLAEFMLGIALFAVALAILPISLAIAAAVPAVGVLYLRSLQKRMPARQFRPLGGARRRYVPPPSTATIACVSGAFGATVGTIGSWIGASEFPPQLNGPACGAMAAIVAMIVSRCTEFSVTQLGSRGRKDPIQLNRRKLFNEIKLVDGLISKAKKNAEADVLAKLTEYRLKLFNELRYDHSAANSD